MRTTVKWMLILMLVMPLLSFVACSDDDDDDLGGPTDPPVEADVWVGQWLSADDNVAPILVTVFQYDSVRVWLNEDQTVRLDAHVEDGAWTTTNGTYVVTESDEGDVHTVRLIYPAFEQEGIIQVIEGTPDEMKLEAVQVIPDISAVPRTPETGFGSDPTLGDLNIQTYIREE